MSNKDISICIAHRGPVLGLWSTINSLEFELQEAKLDFEFSIVSNGEKPTPDLKQTLGELKRTTDYLSYHEHSDEPLTPQEARTRAFKNSTGKYVFFADNHILVCPGFFKRLMHDWEAVPDADMLHSATQYYPKDLVLYGYKLQLKKDFWGSAESVPYYPHKPFPIAAGGHGGVSVKRDSFEKYGGYHLSSAFEGYAGEELTSDLSIWLQGGKVYMSPLSIHRHWAAATRGYSRHHSSDFYKNLFSCAYILADTTADDYVYPMAEHFKKCAKPYQSKSMFDLRMEAKERSKPFTEWLRGRRQRTLEEQLHWFLTNEVSYR